MNWIKNLALSGFVTLLILITIEFSVKFFYDSVAPFSFEEWLESKPKAFQNDEDYDLVLKGFNGKCSYPIPIYENQISAYENDWSCGEVTVSKGKRLTMPELNDWVQTIHIFGGSTVWGRGAVDNKTIPSLIQTSLKNKNIRVLNYGMISYVSMQQTDTLLAKSAEIKKGDIVIYNDGWNDFYHSVINGNPDGFIIGFNNQNKMQIYRYLFTSFMYREVYTYRFISDLIKGNKRPTNDMKCAISHEIAKTRVEGSVEHLVKRVREAKRLTESLGASFIHFYQPSLLDSKNLTEYESQIMSHYPCMRVAKPLRHEFNSLFLESNKDSIDQTHLLIGTDLFFDYVHTGFEGNKIIADNIVETLLNNYY